MKVKRYNPYDNTPQSVDEAITILDNFKRGIPYEAIRYLQAQKPSAEIHSKVLHALQNTYSGFYYNKNENYYAPTPLWYATVAETHLNEDLIDPVIELFSTNDDWDAMSEQGEFLIGVLSEMYPDIVVKKVMDFIDKMNEENPSAPYLYLFDTLYKVDVLKYKGWFLKILMSNCYWDGLFASVVADLGITEGAPVINERLASMGADNFERGQYLHVLSKFSENQSIPLGFCKTRGNWEERFIIFEDVFFNDGKLELLLKNTKIGRNDACPCGKRKLDGKPFKYKKCCGGA